MVNPRVISHLRGVNMKVESKGIVIHLEQDEIGELWDILTFAKDHHIQETKKGKTCMFPSELKLCDALLDITEKLR